MDRKNNIGLSKGFTLSALRSLLFASFTLLFALCSLLLASLTLPSAAYAADKLVVNNGTTNLFKVTDTGLVGIGTEPIYDLHVAKTVDGGLVDVSCTNLSTSTDSNTRASIAIMNGAGAIVFNVYGKNADGTFFGIKRANAAFVSDVFSFPLVAFGLGTRSNSPIYLATNDTVRLTVRSDGNVGIGTTDPPEKLYVTGNIYATGSITQGSSRGLKTDIRSLTTEEAFTALKGLTPTKFQYKADLGYEHLGFIAEDVPDLVATKDRKGVDAMDIVAVLTKVMQEQQKTIKELSEKVNELEKEVKLKGNMALYH